MNTNKKLALNKQIMANLDSQNMAEVKGGVSVTDLVTIGFGLAFGWAISNNFDAKGICLTNKCSSPDWCGPFTQDCPQTDPGDCIW